MAYLDDKEAAFANQFIKKLFVGCVFVGSLFIWFFSQTNNAYLTLGVPMAIMFFYVGMGFLKTNITKVSDQFADSIYYLGFLYTLVALAVSLYAIHKSGYDLKGGGLISRFGLALVTTIIGLFFRIYIVNFRHNIDDLQKISEAKLSVNVENFAVQISSSVEKLKVFNKNLIQTMDSLVNTTTKNIEQTTSKLETFTDNLKESLDNISSEMEAANKRFIEQFNKSIDHTAEQIEKTSVKGFEDLSTGMNKFQGELTEALNQFVAKLDDVILPPDLFSSKLESPLNQLIDSLQNMANEIDQTELPANVITSKFEEPLNNFKAYLNTFVETIDEYIFEQGRMDHETKNLSAGLNNLNGHVSDLSNLITDVYENMQVVKKLSVNTNQFASSFQNASYQATNFSNETQKHMKVTEKITEQFERDLKLANELRQKMGAEFEGARSIMKSMTKEILNAARYINQKFNSEL